MPAKTMRAMLRMMPLMLAMAKIVSNAKMTLARMMLLLTRVTRRVVHVLAKKKSARTWMMRPTKLVEMMMMMRQVVMGEKVVMVVNQVNQELQATTTPLFLPQANMPVLNYTRSTLGVKFTATI
jgi:hypothetical protein